MRIEIHYGGRFGKYSPSGMMLIDPAVWLREKGGIRDFRKILSLCRESDRDHGTNTLDEWTSFLEAEPSRIRQEALETAKEYNRECEAVRKKYDDPGLPVEKKRKALREMDKELRAARRTFDTQMKHLAQALEKSQKLLEEARAT